MFREPATNFVQYKLHINKNYTVEEYRLYLKRGDKLQGEFFRCKLIKIQINRRPERVVFQLNWIFYIEDYIQQQTLKLCGIFSCNWNNTFKIHVPNLMAVKSSYFLSSITLKKCSKYPPPKSIQAWTHLVMDCRTLQRSEGGSEWFDRHKKCVGEVSCHF